MIKAIDLNLVQRLDAMKSTQTRDAMAYSILGGGKRLRPRLLLTLLEDLVGSYELGLNAASALEYIHTYSLIHDDLPAMDDDDVRRFKPTNHIVFGEGQAILAGDALLNEAPAIIVRDKRLTPIQKIQCIEVLALNAGPEGMILGQELDVDDQIETLDHLVSCYELKTGCLFAAALEMATIIADRSDLQEQAHEVGILLGVAFQFQDDLLEATKSLEEIGKSVASDTDRNKTTIVSLLGVDRAQQLTNERFQKLSTGIKHLNLSNTALQTLIEEIVKRPL